MYQWIKQYLEALSRSKSEATLKSYQPYLKRFADWLADTFGAKTRLTQTVVEHYKYWLEKQGYSPRTLNYHLIVLRGLVRFLRGLGQTDLDPGKIALFKVAQKKGFDFLAPEELEKILKLNWTGVGEFQGLRNRLIVGLFYCTGLRLSEAAGLNKEQVDLENLAVRGLGRELFIAKDLAAPLRRYFAKRVDGDPALFVREFKGRGSLPGQAAGSKLRLSERSLERVVSLAGRLAGLRRPVSPHLLRHTLGVDLRSAGLGLKQVQKVLGYETYTEALQYPPTSGRAFGELHQRYLQAYAE